MPHVGRLANEVLRYFRQANPRLRKVRMPQWLVDSRWRPAFCAAIPGDGRIIAVDVIPSACVPRAIYAGEVMPLMDAHPHLRVIICVKDEMLNTQQETERFCRARGIGLVAVTAGIGLDTIIPSDTDPPQQPPTKAEEGWFPRAIIDKVRKLTRLSFRSDLRVFADAIQGAGRDLGLVTRLVEATVDVLLQKYPGCRPSNRSFMRLQNFETLLRMTDPASTEHVLHSFRVFLAGCVILDRFYQKCVTAHMPFKIGRARKNHIEYCWLLVAIFHDIGKPLEVGGPMLQEQFDDEDILVSIEVKDTRWTREKYRDARRLLASLGAFVANVVPGKGMTWDGGAVTSQKALELGTAWTILYNHCRSHAVISAFDMFAEIIEQASAADKTANRPIIITYAAPAALAILLHDWRIWHDAATWGLFPVDGGVLPLAAMLIYLDTWDDFKRTGPVSPIEIDLFRVGRREVEVVTRWHSAEALAKETKKHDGFKTALCNCLFGLRITPLLEESR